MSLIECAERARSIASDPRYDIMPSIRALLNELALAVIASEQVRASSNKGGECGHGAINCNAMSDKGAWWYQPAKIADETFVVLLCRNWSGSFSAEPKRSHHSMPATTYSTWADAEAEARRLNEE